MPSRSNPPGPPPATLGAFEAKTRLAELLEHVARTGASITITRRGVPVARLVPLEGEGARAPERLLGSFRAFSAAHPLPPGLTARELVDEGRRR
jgi:prevent-host-death family protein